MTNLLRGGGKSFVLYCLYRKKVVCKTWLMNKRKYDISVLITKYGCTVVNDVIQNVSIYFILVDIDKGTNHYKIFSDLFLKQGKTYEDIAKENYISESTLKRYAKQYVHFIEKLL